MSMTKTKKSAGTNRGGSYASAIRTAYNYGFRDGYAAHENLPNVRGARSAAKYGYGRGLSAHNKVNKYQTKAGRK